MAESKFTFIDNTSIDRASRKAIRSHVMKGKNLGKRRPRQRRLAVASRAVMMAPATTAGNQSSYQALRFLSGGFDEFDPLAPSLLFHVGHELSGLISPFEVTDQDRKGIHRFMSHFSEALYPPQFSIKASAVKAIFLQYVFIDEAYFHSFLAMSAACIDFVTGQHTTATSNMHHLFHALRLINEKLSSQQALSEIAVASVIALCFFENMREDIEKMKVHFEGLSSMIKLRGGLGTLNMTPALAEKARRVDLDLALQLGQPPRLIFTRLYPESVTQSSSQSDCELPSPFSQLLREANMDLYIATRDIMKMTRLLTSEVEMAEIAPEVMLESLTSLIYHLLSVDTIFGEVLPDPLSKAVHIVMLAFLTTSIIRFDHQRRMKYKLISRNCVARLHNPEFFDSTADIPKARLWMLFVAEGAVLGPSEHTWLIPSIVETSRRLGISEWSEALSSLEKYPWIPSVNEKPALRLWKTCFEPH